MMYWNDGWTPMMIFPMIMPLLMIAAVVVAMRMIRSSSGRSPTCGHHGHRNSLPHHRHGTDPPVTEDPQAVLRLRYARGEITRSQYEDLRDESLIDLLRARVARGELSLDQYEAELDHILTAPQLRRQDGSAATSQSPTTR